METAILKGTRKDLGHPKLKHVQALISMSWSGMSVSEFFLIMVERFRTSNWVVALKGLMIVHILMQQGNFEAMYDFINSQPEVLDLSKFRDRSGSRAIEQSKNVRFYAAYLRDKALAFRAVGIDFLSSSRPKSSQIYSKTVTDIKSLHLELSTVQKQLHSLLKFQFEPGSLDNDCTFSAFKYTLADCLKLFQIMNEGEIKTLKLFFDMEEVDMRRALDLYKRYIRLTERTSDFLLVARKFELILNITIPELLHAPLTLVNTLQEHLSLSENERKEAASEINEYRKITTKTAQVQSSRKHSTKNSNSNSSSSNPYNMKNRPLLRLKPELLPRNSTINTSNKNTNQPSSTENNNKSSTTQGGLEKKASVDDLIDFFANIDENINTPGNSLQLQNQQSLNQYSMNAQQFNFALNSLQNSNTEPQSYSFQQYQDIISSLPPPSTSNPFPPPLETQSSQISQLGGYSFGPSSQIQHLAQQPISQNIVTAAPSFASNNTLNAFSNMNQTPNNPFAAPNTEVRSMSLAPQTTTLSTMGTNQAPFSSSPFPLNQPSNTTLNSNSTFGNSMPFSTGIPSNPQSVEMGLVSTNSSQGIFNNAIEKNPFRNTMVAPFTGTVAANPINSSLFGDSAIKNTNFAVPDQNTNLFGNVGQTPLSNQNQNQNIISGMNSTQFSSLGNNYNFNNQQPQTQSHIQQGQFFISQGQGANNMSMNHNGPVPANENFANFNSVFGV
ncbi:hypothetical protein BB560_000167 [Smittium megazygosporum]|uniref:ENTH domain-containing protein n=1 Tax=Smittium megazygosporum TaxID=133381 RepID=A0A2T9ZL56_9FUNG|nr:hypothetical protein BB560_000167 [Smittium megazygosporum]